LAGYAWIGVGATATWLGAGALSALALLVMWRFGVIPAARVLPEKAAFPLQ